MNDRRNAPKTLVLCLGNRIRKDDGVGWRVAESLLADPPRGAEVRMTALSGLYLLDEMEGFDRVVVVDAVATGKRPPGAVVTVPLSAVEAPPGASPHGLGLPSALRSARALGAPVPAQVDVVAIEVADMATVEVGLTPAVAAAVPVAVVRVRELVAGPAPDEAGLPPHVAASGGLAASRWFP